MFSSERLPAEVNKVDLIAKVKSRSERETTIARKYIVLDGSCSRMANLQR